MEMPADSWGRTMDALLLSRVAGGKLPITARERTAAATAERRTFMVTERRRAMGRVLE